MATKGVLCSDPSIGMMNPCRWAFEASSLAMHQEEKIEDARCIMEAVKKAVINLLGLNILPIEDPETGLLRRPEDNEIVPLAALIGSPEIMSEIYKKNGELSAQMEAEESVEEGKDPNLMDADELDDFIDGDIDFVDGLDDFVKFANWESVEAKKQREQLIEVVPDLSGNLVKPKKMPEEDVILLRIETNEVKQSSSCLKKKSKVVITSEEDD